MFEFTNKIAVAAFIALGVWMGVSVLQTAGEEAVDKTTQIGTEAITEWINNPTDILNISR